MNYVYAGATSIILIFIFLIAKKQQKSAADYYLIAVNLLIGLFLLADVLINWRLTSVTAILQNAVPLFLFPTYILYVAQFTHADKYFSPLWYLLFAPGVVFLLFSCIDHFLLNSYTTPDAIAQHFNDPIIWYQLIFKGSQLLFIGTLLYMLRLLKQFAVQLEAGYSTIDTIEVEWLIRCTWIYLGAVIITFVLFLSQNLGLLPFEIGQVFSIVYAILVASVFYLNYEGIQHYTLAQVSNKVENLPPTEDGALNRQQDYVLSPEETELEREILALLAQEQWYLEPRFSLEELAERIGKSKHQVSRVLNSKEDRSFYELVNRFRVDHLKKMLADPSNAHLTILALGLASGFNSKASLNRIFKKITGLTPRQYMSQKSQLIA